jgi:hypothetical protein
MTTPRKYRVWRAGDGWRCSISKIKFTSFTGPTLEAVIAAAEAAEADYDQMVQHHDGVCPAGCKWCERHPETKGAFLPKGTA